MDKTNDDTKMADPGTVATPAQDTPAPATDTNQPSANTPSEPVVASATEDLEILKAKARLAMEGTEHTAKREKIEHERTLIEEKKVLTARLEEVKQKKGALELEWVKFDTQKKILGEKLDPVIKEEEKVENEEMKIETEEQAMGLAREKQEIEKKRRQIEDTRRKIEDQKWVIEEKVWQVDDATNQATQNYQNLLTEEERIVERLAEIERELI